MILNVYIYKGPAQSIIGPWILSSFLLEDIAQNYEKEIPHKKSLFNIRKSLNKYDYIIKNNLTISFITCSDINITGELSIYNSLCKIKAYASAKAIEQQKTLKINIFTTPTIWYERLIVLYAVFYRRQYLLRISNKKINYNLLDSNIEEHINLLLQYKHLPPLYIRNKCLNLFKDIYPKPIWWTKEININKK